ncbi:hypothetical protein BDR22DRAFT_45834 [Usnea florida]
MRNRKDASSDRPIIFIGHSFGGLVIEQAVVQAQSVGNRYEYLVKLIGGVVLLGTPHQGSQSQKWGSIIAQVASVVDCGETALMKEVDEKSMKIFDLVSEFKKIMISLDLAKTAVLCFYENLPTSYMARVVKTGEWLQRQTSSMVVEEKSAVLSGFYSVVLDSDHLKLNKFAGAQDGNYVSVSSNLCRIAAEAPELIQRRHIGTSSSQTIHFLVPRERVKDFIGRENMLESIRSHFIGNQTGPPPCVVLHALGGQGKSQIALEYCRKWRETYRGVFWINANSEMTTTQSFGTIAGELEGASKLETSDSAALIRLVTGNLEQWREAWLLVFDNYDDPESFATEIRSFIPTRHGHVLFTSRNRDLSRLGTLLEIPPMATEDGVRLLLRGYNVNDIQRQHEKMASSIVGRLGNLALAIDQAAAYIKYKRLLLDRLGDFLTTYEAERKKVLTYTPKNWEYKHINAFTTWELSFQQLISGNEPWKTDVAHFLTLSAFFAPTKISESLFRFYQRAHGSEVRWIRMYSTSDVVEEDGNANSNEENDKASTQTFDGSCNDEWSDVSSNTESCASISEDEWSPDKFWDIIANSDDLSLLQSISPAVGHQGASFSLHPVIRDWLQLRLRKQERRGYTQEAMTVLVCCIKTYRDRSSSSLEERTALTAHMDVSMSNDENFSKSQDKLGGNIANCDTANFFAKFYRDQGRYRVSEDLLRRLVETRRRNLGEKNLLTLTSMRDLAYILCWQQKHGEAEQMFRQIICSLETELGEMHPETIDCIDWLALSLSSQDKYREAELIYRSTLALREKEQIGDVLDAVRNRERLANVLSNQKKYDEAEEIHQSTLLVQRKILGKDHPNILKTMVSLAETQVYQNKYEDAERMCKQTIIIQEKMFGSEHDDTLSSLITLIRILREEGKHEEAEKVCRRVLVARETQLGKEHPYTLDSMQDLVRILDDQNRYDEAERLCRQTLKLRETVQALENPDTLRNMHILGLLLERQGKHEEAESVVRKTLVLRETVQGLENPDTLRSMDTVGLLLERQGKYEEAESVCRKTLVLRETVQGLENPDTLRSMDALGLILKRQGKYEEAESVFRKTLVLRETVQGLENPDTLESMDVLGLILETQGKHEEAISLFQQTLMIREKIRGKDHPDTVRTMELLDDILAAEGNDEDTEQIPPENPS